MNEIENLFIPLIEEFDDFLREEETKVGCLKSNEHSEFVSIRNHIDDVFMKKLNERYPKPQKEQKQDVQLACIPFLDDNDDGADISKRKRSHELER